MRQCAVPHLSAFAEPLQLRNLKCFPNRMLGNRSANHSSFLPILLPWSETARPISPPNDATGAYRILVFHFAEGSNASGFVAWLAGIMKKGAGTGVMVVCGFDARATPAMWQTSLGLFDYWGCPWGRGDEVAALVERLRREGAH